MLLLQDIYFEMYYCLYVIIRTYPFIIIVIVIIITIYLGYLG